MLVGYPCRIFTLITLLLTVIAGIADAGVIKGTVTDYDSGEPIPYATVRVEGTGRSTLANDQGEYRLRLENGRYILKFSHIAHYSEKAEIKTGDSSIIYNVKLRPSMLILRPLKVYDRRYDPAQRIIVEAIKRKDDILNQLHDYSFQAYARMVVRDTAKPDTTDIMYIAESQLECFWEQPEKYKEIITGRKSSANLESENVILGVGGILNMNLNRIELNEYSIVSPVAEDALEKYNYYLLDTIYIDSLAVFRLEIEPKSESTPLFVGTIDIADSTYNVVGVDVGFNDALKMPFVDSLRFVQTFAEYENKYWMPIEQRIEGIVDINLPGIPVMNLDYLASLYRYSFDRGHPKETFDDYVLEVAEDADDIDSTTWLAGQTVPLTEDEIRAYYRIDSTVHAPKPILKRTLGITTKGLSTLIGRYEFFHFNRVEGAYLGARFRQREILPRLDIDLRSGWAFDGEYWQHGYNFRYLLYEKKRLFLTAGYHDLIVASPTIFAGPNFNPTIFSALNKTDPLDYLLEKGFEIGLDMRLIRSLSISSRYHDYNQYSVANSTEFSVLRKSKKHAPNPEISDGKLRAVSAKLVWDSRPLMREKKVEFRLLRLPYVAAEVGLERADPEFLSSDFDYSRYYISIYARRRTFGLGVSSVYLYGGSSDKELPRQRFFAVDFGSPVFSRIIQFKTLHESKFLGNRVVVVYLSHNFGRFLFQKSRVPLVKDLPFSLIIYGGVFWSDFQGHLNEFDNDHSIMKAIKPYGEIGFGLAGILPLNMGLDFTWQLSDYETRRFVLDIYSAFF